MSRIDESIQAKREKQTQLEEMGILTRPYSYDKKHSVKEARLLEGKVVQTAGRVMAVRTHGGVTFLDLQDFSGTIQVMVRKKEIDEKTWQWLSLLDRGDFLGARGKVTLSKTGELSILSEELTFLGKSLRPLPTAFNQAEDKEVRFRKRYLDMLINPETKRVLDARWLIEKELRHFLQNEHNFVEVETPVLQPLYGGTNATPFSTHMNALDTDFYLRIAPELYLKRLIVGGYDKVFEIARNFRNEGIDQTHQPEFTMVEWYEAYADYHRMMDVAEDLFKYLAKKVCGNTTIQIGEKTLDIGVKWPRIRMEDALKDKAGISFEKLSDDECKELAEKHQIKIKGEYTRGKVLFELFDKLATPHLIEPTWIIDYPRDISPLSKEHRLDKSKAERFEGYIGGKELCDGWSEIVDPLDQRQIFENEQRNMRAGDTEAHPLDEDFLETMEYGMPPLGGIGIGIDRLVMFLTNTWSIKEVIAFPTLRPLQKQVGQTGSSGPDGSRGSSVSGSSGGPRRSSGTSKSNEPSNSDGSPQSNSLGKKSKPSNLGAPKKSKTLNMLPDRADAEKLLNQYIKNEALKHHCYMVAEALEAYAKVLGENNELWYQAGLLHDLDWEMYPDEHPNIAITEILVDYPEELKRAIAAHAPSRTNIQPEALLERYIFATDELSGFLHAYSLMRPKGFAGMNYKSVKKKLKDKGFASGVNREDIRLGFELIGKDPAEHVAFLIEVFS